MTPMFSFNLDNPYSPFDASYKFLNPGTPRPETDLLDTDLKPICSASMFSQQAFPPPGQHPWSNMVFGEACMPTRQMSPRISPRSSISSNSSCSSSTSPLQSPISSSFRSRTSSMASDQLVSHLEATGISTHESNTLFAELVPSNKLHHSDPDLPSLAPDSSLSDTLAPSDAFSHPNMMSKDLRAKFPQTISEDREMDHDDQDMSDQHDNIMDVDLNESNESNDEDDEEEAGSPRSTRASRESSSFVSDYAPTRGPQTRASRRAATLSTKASQPVSKPSSRPKRSSTTGAKNSASTTLSAATSSRKPKATSTKSPNRASSTVPKGSSSASRKHPSSEEESPDAKRQRFLERNRMAASKCREKKRLQTLRTIADADAITARNQALHESLDELQEEVRALKNQILCHRDCGCDVIRKFVQSSYGSASCLAGSVHLGSAPTRSQPQLC